MKDSELTWGDLVNHDVLMGKLAKRIADARMLRLIRRYLEAGVMMAGVAVERHEGTPQGGPLSPLLANVLLDEVDKETKAQSIWRGIESCLATPSGWPQGERSNAGSVPKPCQR